MNKVNFYDVDFADIEKGLYKLGVCENGDIFIMNTELRLPICPNEKGQVYLCQSSKKSKYFNISEIYEWVVCIKDSMNEYYDINFPERIIKDKYKINEQGQVIYTPKHLKKYGIYLFYKSVYGNSVQLKDKYGDTFKLNSRYLVYTNIPKYIDTLKNDFVDLIYEDVKKDAYKVNSKGDVFSLGTYRTIKYANESTCSYSLQTENGKCKSITRNRAKAIYELVANNRDVWCEVRKRNIKQKYSETYVRNICKLLVKHKGDFKAVLKKEFGITRQKDDESLSRLVRSLANRKTWSNITKEYKY